MNNRRQFRLDFLTWVVAILAVGGVGAQTPAGAETDEWSFVVTPQVWISHIAKNGFASPPNSSIVGGAVLLEPTSNPNVFSILQNPFSAEQSPNEVLDPQWGIQFAAQKGRWSLAGAFQYVTFETRYDVNYVSPNGTPLCFGTCINSGARFAQEFVNTTRMDVDLSTSYFFPDVVKDRLDVSLGAGFKFIYATASRQYANMSNPATNINAIFGGLYTSCSTDEGPNSPDCVAKDRVKVMSYLYGATFPMNATLHLTNDAKWLLPFSVTPLIGAETRNDNNVVYSATVPSTLVVGQPFSTQVNRTDGTTFAYGVTADATVRWIINDTFSAYAGMRVQYINGHEVYLAYGPLVGASVRFGGK